MKTYLGDSVYADLCHLDPSMIKLTTENGLPGDPSNTIFLEAEVFAAFIAFARAHGFEIPEEPA